MPARTSPTLLPHPLALCCHYPVSKCRSASIAVTGTVRVKNIKGILFYFVAHWTMALSSLRNLGIPESAMEPQTIQCSSELQS